ncbi:flagellar motor protein [Noviherbaspirillum sedimenti]|uniref:Flagellar motor protein n=1 Tax=Noviherbaspirillum sedimenti TaxID=2320865 RepID=A0A3A3FYG4_9BURK|nr:flagellar motor protein [Noviherbaspirillum sedimenti]RJG01187.1 flagellar motor protein [Noviherbaspirillum sedimenti]
MDWASVAGIALALGGLLAGQLLEGGHLGSLVQPAAFIIVGVGTVGAVLLQSGMPDFVRGVRMARSVFVLPADTSAALELQVTTWSALARREGLLSLERYLDGVKEPFKAKGLRMLIDGIDPFKLKDILEAELDSYERRERLAIKVWDAAGGYAPTVGIIGAVLGLIHVMENLANPAQLGSGIAVAFVATIYGVGLANLVFLPIANKLKSLLAHEVAQREMLIAAFFGIALGDNPRVIQERMSAHRH